MRKDLRACRTVALAMFVAGCTGITSLPLPDDYLAVGTWGGNDAGMIVTDSTVHVHVGCTSGDIDGRVKIDGNGRFTADGSYVLRAFPIAVGPTLPAQFSGRISGRTLIFTIAVSDTVEKKLVALGPVAVEYGRAANMGPCPICVLPLEKSFR